MGAWVDTLFPVHVGAELVVSFTPPGEREELTLFAKVARVVTGRRKRDRGPIGMALSFLGVSRQECASLAAD